MELHAPPDKGSLYISTAPVAPQAAPATETDARGEMRAEVDGGGGGTSKRGDVTFVRAVGGVVQVSGLRPCTMYRLTLEMPPLVRHDLLESARYFLRVGAFRASL